MYIYINVHQSSIHVIILIYSLYIYIYSIYLYNGMSIYCVCLVNFSYIYINVKYMNVTLRMSNPHLICRSPSSSSWRLGSLRLGDRD